MVANRQERGCGRQHRECSRVDRISGRTNGRWKRTKSGSNTSVVPVSHSCRTKIVLAVLDRQRSGVMATIWWFCHDHDRSGRSAMIGNIGKEWSAQCDLGFMHILYLWCIYMYCVFVYVRFFPDYRGTEITKTITNDNVKSLQLIWSSGTRWFHLQVPDLVMNWRELT